MCVVQATRFVACQILSVAGNSTPNVQERGVVVYHCSVLFACYLLVYRSSSVYFSFCLFNEIINENRLVYGFVSDMFFKVFKNSALLC